MTFMIREDEDEAISAGRSTTLKIDIAAGVEFKISKIAVKYTGNFKITRIYDSGAKFDFLKGNFHETHFQEDNGRVMKLPVPLVITGPTSLKFDITDTSGSPNKVYLACIGDETP